VNLSRRAFLDLCKGSALGIGAFKLAQLGEVLASPGAPTVIWLQGAGCTGCSVSFLNRISRSAPLTAADALVRTIHLAYHPTLMAAAGESATRVLRDVQNSGSFVLAVEGGVPTAFGGACCWAYNADGRDVTFLSAVGSLAAKARAVLSIGTCAAYGGVASTAANPAGVKSVSEATGKATINIPGCPPHPDWIVWTIANHLTDSIGRLDRLGRPRALFGKTVHDRCPRTPPGEQHKRCLEPWGCQGKRTFGACPRAGFNNGVSWCVDQNSPCLGCTEPTFAAASMRRAAPTANCYAACHGKDGFN
jgi:hydrogenase small subunit